MSAEEENDASEFLGILGKLAGTRCVREDSKDEKKQGLFRSVRKNGRVSVTAYIRHFNGLSASEKEKVLENGGESVFFPQSYRLQQVTSITRSSGGVNSWLHNAAIFLIRALGHYFTEWWGEKNTEVELYEPNDVRTHVQLNSRCGAGVPVRGFADFYCTQLIDGKRVVIDIKTSVNENNSLASVANKLKHIQQLRVYALLVRWLFLDDRYTPACYIASVNPKRSDCFQLFRVVFSDDFRSMVQALNVEYNSKAVIKRLDELK